MPNWFTSRRAVVSSLAIVPLAAFAARAIEAADTALLTLGREFDEVAAQVDHGIDDGSDFADGVLNRLGQILTEIEAMPATTIEGLSVKARVACWALLGDLDTPDQSTSDERMTLSILRDLIRRYDGRLERPGAIKKLVAEISNEN